MSVPGERVLVTGAGGFIGSHLAADQARRGRRVVAVDLQLGRVRHLGESGRFDLVEGDFTEPAVQTRAIEGVDTVFHLAAAHLGTAVEDEEFRRVNVLGVRSLVEAARRSGVRRFVHCSTVGVYGEVTDPPADEDSPCRPDLAYERTKLEGEMAVREAVAKTAFPAVVLRPAWVYGPGCPRTEKLLRSIRRGRFVMAGRGDALRHCIYIRDMVEAFELAATRDAAVGQVMVVGDSEAVPVRRLLEEIASIVRARPPRSVPLPLLRLACLAAEIVCRPFGKEPPFSRRTLKFFTNNTAFDVSRARRILGFEPRYDLRAGLTETHRILTDSPGWRVPLPEPRLA